MHDPTVFMGSELTQLLAHLAATEASKWAALQELGLDGATVWQPKGDTKANHSAPPEPAVERIPKPVPERAPEPAPSPAAESTPRRHRHHSHHHSRHRHHRHHHHHGRTRRLEP